MATGTGQLEDEQLARAAQAGDRASFDELARRHASRLFRFAFARLGNAHDAEEAAQETLLKVWSARHRYDPARPFTTWLLMIAHREAVTILRRRRRAAQPLGAEPVAITSAPTAPPASTSNIWTIAGRLLDRETYTALYLRYATDCAPRDVAMILGRSPSWVRVALHRARQALSSAMSGYDETSRAAQDAGRQPLGAAHGGET
jgi:RNA polymerase sigma-70 factor (ECF subfamily)